MNEQHNPWFDATVQQLNDPQNQRVWSVIVSLFGDLAQEKGAQISGGALTRIITPMGIKPEAIRVALHRLRKDGWIESARAGRASVHYLTEYGRKQSAAVTPRIYERRAAPPGDWHLLIAEGSASQTSLEEVLLLPNYVAVNRTTALGHGPVPGIFDDLMAARVNTVNVPGWLKSRVFPDQLRDACAALQQDLERIPAPPPGLTPAQCGTLRTLIVHRWRRVVLRHPDLPPVFHPEDWAGESCRTQVFQLLDQLPLPDLSDLDTQPD
ncbi:MAG: PaaX family transcriptional regulator C-terminal domain-containing protein [Leisingera sp.]